MQKFIKEHFAYPLYSKKIIWKKYVRIFCDGGQPIWRWVPKYHKEYYAPYWGLTGFCICIFGREIFVVFGEDKNHLYYDEKDIKG